MQKAENLRKELGDSLKEHIVLRDFTWIKVGGVADYFYVANDINSLIKTIEAAKLDNMPYLVLGGGSNVVISDYGFPGLVIINRSNNISFLPDKTQVIVDSGVVLTGLVLKAVNNNMGGIQNLFGVPGTVGGALYGNAGAYGTEIYDVVKTVTVLTPSGKIITKDRDWFEPQYRSTKLKREKNKNYIILTARIQLASTRKDHLLTKINEIKQDRDRKFSGLGPSCGSIFKNPFPGRSFKTKEEAIANSAGYLLEKIGAKKIKFGDAQVYKNHANMIENKGKATANDIKNLVGILKDKVAQETNKILEEEIEFLGQWE